MITNIKHSKKGFTIIELMIATLVLSVLITLVTATLINMSHLYYKGSSQAHLQDSLRNLNQDVTENLQLSTGYFRDCSTDSHDSDYCGNTSIPHSYCIGINRYTYILNTEVNSTYKHVFWKDILPALGTACTNADLTQQEPSSGGVDLLGNNTELTSFDINNVSTPFSITISMAYGSPDLFTLNGSSTHCNGGSADELCAVASLSTNVDQRLASTPD